MKKKAKPGQYEISLSVAEESPGEWLAHAECGNWVTYAWGKSAKTAARKALIAVIGAAS